MRKVLLGLALFSTAFAEQVVSSQALCQYGTPEGTPANLVFTLDYSGSMNWDVYEDSEYSPNKIYLGYFDPFALYKLTQLNGTTYLWEKDSSYPLVNRKPELWAIGYNDSVNLYSGNYLNYIYTNRVSLLRALLTGGNYKSLTVSTGQGCALKLWFSSDNLNKIHNKKVKAYLEDLLNGVISLQNGNIITTNTDIVIEYPIPCSVAPIINKEIFYYHLARSYSNHHYKHWQHKICNVLPEHHLRYICKKADDLDAQIIENSTTETIYVIPLIETNPQTTSSVNTAQNQHRHGGHGNQSGHTNRHRHRSKHKNNPINTNTTTTANFYLRMEDAFTYDGTSLVGLLQRLEVREDRPRVEGLLFANGTKALVDPSYIYDELITDINNTVPSGTTYTGEALEEIKNNFSIHNGTETDPYVFPVEDANGNISYITVNNPKNWDLLYSDGEWNGMVDPAVVAYDMWKGGYADLVSNLDGNQNVETYTFSMFLNPEDYGYIAMQNIAIFGGFTDKDGNKIPKGYENYFSTNGTINHCYFDYDISRKFHIQTTANCFDSRIVKPPVEADTLGEWYIDGHIKNFFGEEKIAKLYFNTYKLFADNIANHLEEVYCGEEPAIVPIPEKPVNLIKEIIDNLQVLKENSVDPEQVKALIAYALEEIALTQTGSIRQYLNQLAEQVLQSASLDEAVAKAKQAVLNAVKQQIEVAEENPTVTNLQTVVQTAHHVAKLVPGLDNLANQLEQQLPPNSSTVNTFQAKKTLTEIKQALQTGKILLWLEY